MNGDRQPRSRIYVGRGSPWDRRPCVRYCGHSSPQLLLLSHSLSWRVLPWRDPTPRGEVAHTYRRKLRERRRSGRRWGEETFQEFVAWARRDCEFLRWLPNFKPTREIFRSIASTDRTYVTRFRRSPIDQAALARPNLDLVDRMDRFVRRYDKISVQCVSQMEMERLRHANFDFLFCPPALLIFPIESCRVKCSPGTLSLLCFHCWEVRVRLAEIGRIFP